MNISTVLNYPWCELIGQKDHHLMVMRQIATGHLYLTCPPMTLTIW